MTVNKFIKINHHGINIPKNIDYSEANSQKGTIWLNESSIEYMTDRMIVTKGGLTINYDFYDSENNKSLKGIILGL